MMKKLSKLKLNEVAVLSDGEMKNVFGGFTTGTGTGSDNGFGEGENTCSCTGEGCAGSCPDKVQGNWKDGFRLIPQTCTSEWIRVAGGNYLENCTCK